MHRQPREHTYRIRSGLPQTDWSSETPYDAKPGLCVIINNMVFTKQGLAGMPQGKRDEDSLNVIFSSLGFDVKVHQNLAGQEITSQLVAYSRMEHKGAFFVAILSHGCLIDNLPAVYGKDGQIVKILDLESLFTATNCSSLAGKPKIFLIDACRGHDEEKILHQRNQGRKQSKSSIGGSDDMRKGSFTSTSTDIHVPDSADFLLIYASTHGRVAFTSHRGSDLTQSFTNVITEASEDITILEITQEVQRRVRISSGSRQVAEIINRLDRKYFIKRNTDLTNLQELHKRFRQAVTVWGPVRDYTIQQIQQKAEELKIHHRDVNISRIVGSTASIGGSVMAIVGFGLAPVTLGGSLALSVPGVTIAVLGGSTAAGASIVDIALEKMNLKSVQEQIERDYDQVKAIQDLAKKINQIIETTKSKCPEVDAGSYAVLISEVVSIGGIRLGNIGLKLTDLAVTGTLKIGAAALRVGGATAKGIAAAGIVFNVVLIPIDIFEIVRSSLSLRRGSQTNSVQRLIDIAAQLKEQQKSIKGQAGIE